MSSISSISAGNGLSQYLQSLSSSVATGASSTAASPAPLTLTSTDPFPSNSTASPSVAGHHRHGGGGKAGEFFSKIQSAVTSALQAAQNNSSADPNSIVENAIEGVLKQANSPDPATTSTSTTDPTSTTDSATTTNSASSAYQNFLQTLEANGVDPQQFHQDFLNAVQQAQSGQSNPSLAFQNWPLGTAVDAIG